MVQKIQFAKPAQDTFHDALKKRVFDYFATNKIEMHGDWRLYSKTIILFAMFILAYIAAMIRSENASYLIWYGLLGLLIASIGFNVMHDAAHGSYSPNKKLNAFIAFLGGDLMGGSVYIWKIKHNMLHHSFTNIEGHDDDIAKYPLFRMNEHQKLLWFHRYQFLYAPVLYALTTLNWSLIDDYVKLATRKLLIKKINMSSTDKQIFWLGKILNLALFLGIPIFLIGFVKAVIGFVVLHVILGLTLAFVFQLAHIVEKMSFPAPPTMDEFMKHQLATTSNFAMNSSIISWYVGGLNYQVEHHLFQQISHVHYPAISKIVQGVCKEHDVEYHALPTLGKALGSHFAYLYAMGIGYDMSFINA